MTAGLGIATILAIVAVFGFGRWWEILDDQVRRIPPSDRRRVDSEYPALVDRRDVIWWAFIASIGAACLLGFLLVIAP